MRHLSEIRTAIDLKPSVMSDTPFVRFDHVQLAMPRGEEDRAREFYVGVLGLEEVTKPPELAKRGGCWFSSGDVHVHLGVDSDFRPAKKAHPAFRCADYDGYIKRLSDLGIRVVPDEIPLKGKAHCYFADPFGNRIELVAE
jgi:catechol 2,3-dioxygenase-like lactoylglutathione lyase family enzyme